MWIYWTDSLQSSMINENPGNGIRAMRFKRIKRGKRKLEYGAVKLTGNLNF